MRRQSPAPSGQEIRDKDTEVHNHLMELAAFCQKTSFEDQKFDVIAQILADGLSAIHGVITDYFIWDRSGRS